MKERKIKLSNSTNASTLMREFKNKQRKAQIEALKNIIYSISDLTNEVNKHGIKLNPFYTIRC